MIVDNRIYQFLPRIPVPPSHSQRCPECVLQFIGVAHPRYVNNVACFASIVPCFAVSIYLVIGRGDGDGLTFIARKT